jgi:uncharacterized protein (UPF0335 family)
MAKVGHNSKVQSGPVNADRLKSFIERIERMEEERKAIAGDIRDIYAEAKAIGYDVGTMRKVVRLRAMDAADRAEQEALLDTYWHALQTVDRIDARLAAGESQREVAAAEGVSKSTVQRRGPKVESAPASSEMDRSKPEDGDDGITESVEAGSIGVEAGRPSEPSAPAEQSVNAVPPPGLVTPASDNGKGEQPGTHLDEAPAPRSVGAVAAEPRVAPQNLAQRMLGTFDDMQNQPAFLRRLGT